MQFSKIGLIGAVAGLPLAFAQYIPDYVSNDLSLIAIDAVGTMGVTGIEFAGLITLTLLFVWFAAQLG